MILEEMLRKSYREIDALIEKHVFGNDVKWIKDSVRGHFPIIDQTGKEVPLYSDDISTAWKILEKPEIMDRYQIGVYPTSFVKWIARPFMPGGRDCTVQADTAPEAICKCVLLAVLGEEEA
jgi:hypothetical protein